MVGGARGRAKGRAGVRVTVRVRVWMRCGCKMGSDLHLISDTIVVFVYEPIVVITCDNLRQTEPQCNLRRLGGRVRFRASNMAMQWRNAT